MLKFEILFWTGRAPIDVLMFFAGLGDSDAVMPSALGVTSDLASSAGVTV